MTQSPLTTYRKLCTEFYDLEPHKDSMQALTFYMDYAQQANGPILEPMCGTGRFLLPILNAGFEIEGFDASPYMLEALREKYAPNAAPVWQEFVQQLNSPKKYALIFIPYGSFGLITNHEDIIRSLAILHNHLAPGGRLIMEIETVASVPQPCGIWRRGVHMRADGSRLGLSTLSSYNEQTQLFSALCRYESILVDGTIVATETEDYQQYLYHFDEMDRLLEPFGFSCIEKYTRYTKQPANNHNAPLLIYECVK